MSELACVGFSYFFSQFFFFKNRDSFLCFKNNQIDDCAVLNFFLFLYGQYLVIEFHTNRTRMERCDHESGFVRKRIDRGVGTRIVSTSVIQITLSNGPDKKERTKTQ